MGNKQSAEERFEFDQMKEHLIDYVKNRVEFFKLSAIAFSARIAPGIVFGAVLGLILLVFWIFVNVACALWIGNSLNSMPLGFLIIAGANLVLGGLLVLFYKDLIYEPITNWVVKMVTKALHENGNK